MMIIIIWSPFSGISRVSLGSRFSSFSRVPVFRFFQRSRQGSIRIPVLRFFQGPTRVPGSGFPVCRRTSIKITLLISKLALSSVFLSELFSKSKIENLRYNAEAVVQRCYVKKVFLEISQNSHEKNCVRVSFLIKTPFFRTSLVAASGDGKKNNVNSF